jgi:hypothetical protein
VTDEAWIRLADPDDVHLPAGHPYQFGFVAGMSRLISAHPRIAAVWRPLYREVMFAEESALTRAERELVAAVAAVAQDCFY